MNMIKLDLWRLSIFLAFFLFPLAALAQQWTHYTVADGLGAGRVFGICEDKEGNLWFGTDSGPFWFDGMRFHHFEHSQELAEASVLDILQDKKGNLWFATNAGLWRYDGKHLRVFTTKDGLVGDSLWNILEDQRGNIWVTTNPWSYSQTPPNGVSRYDGIRFETFNTENGLVTNRVLRLFNDRAGNVWITGFGGISRYDGHSFRNYPTPSANGIDERKVSAIWQDHTGKFWFGWHNDGVWTYDGKRFRRIPPVLRIYSSIYAIQEDSNGTLWLAGESGLKQFDGNTVKSYSNPLLRNHALFTIFEDSRGDSWFGSDDGVFRYDPSSFQSISFFECHSIYHDRACNVWFGTTYSGVYRYDNLQLHKIKDSERIAAGSFFEDLTERLWLNGGSGTWGGMSARNWSGHARLDGGILQFSPLEGYEEIICSDRSGYLWFRRKEGGVGRYDGKRFEVFTREQGLVGNDVNIVLEDKKGNLWFGAKQGLSRYNGRQFQSFTAKDGLPDNNIIQLFEDSKGRLWIGAETGICYYDGARFQKLTVDDGLADNLVTSIAEDASGNIWLGTQKGACRYEGQKIRTFTTQDGLGSNKIRSIIVDGAGYLWLQTGSSGVTKSDGICFQTFSTKDGLTSNNIAQMKLDPQGHIWFISQFGGVVKHVSDTFLPHVNITQVIADKEYPATQPIELLSSVKRITFTYQGSDFRTRPGQMWYLYKMEGMDDNWQKPTRLEQVDYRNLKPGQYKFYVKAADRDVNYSEPASVTLKVVPPFYLRAIFLGPTISLGAILLAMLITLTIAFVKHRRRISAYQKEAVKELQDAHEMQMSLMPETAPPIEGVEIAGKCVPANTVSGDFFDYLEGKSDNEVALVIADVTGKAMKGAMNAVMTNGILRAKAEEMDMFSPGLLMTRMNSILKARTERLMNVTMVIGRIDARAKILTLANAGHHVLPLLCREGNIQQLQVTGFFPLGVVKDTPYREEKFPLQSGDVLILMTDGIIEAQDSEENYYSDSGRLEKAILQFTQNMSASAMVDAILNDAMSFGGDKAKRDDDMTVVVAKIR